MNYWKLVILVSLILVLFLVSGCANTRLYMCGVELDMRTPEQIRATENLPEDSTPEPKSTPWHIPFFSFLESMQGRLRILVFRLGECDH